MPQTFRCGYTVLEFVAFRFKVILKLLDKSVDLLYSYGTPYGLAVLEQNKCRHRAYIVFLGKSLILIDIHLKDIGSVAYSFLYIFQYRAHHLARTTPCGKEVYQSGLVFIDNFVEVAHNAYVFFVSYT